MNLDLGSLGPSPMKTRSGKAQKEKKVEMERVSIMGNKTCRYYTHDFVWHNFFIITKFAAVCMQKRKPLIYNIKYSFVSFCQEQDSVHQLVIDSVQSNLKDFLQKK